MLSVPHAHTFAWLPSDLLYTPQDFSQARIDVYPLPGVLKMLVIQSCPTLCDPMDCSPARLLCPWDFPDKNIGVGSHPLL